MINDQKYLPIYPGRSSDPKSAFTLDDFLRNWSDFVVRKPFILLVGSLANWKETYGDIDVLIKAKDPTPLIDALDSIIVKMFDQKEEAVADVLIAVQKFLSTDSLFLNAKWRIERAFPDMSDNMHILDDSFSGPFTNFVELADLVSLSKENKVRQEMEEKKVELFQPVPLLKPLHGRTKGEIYSIDSVVDTIKSRKTDWFKANIAVQRKYDGVHCQADKKGGVVRIWTEEGRELTKNCPTLVADLAKISPADFKVIGEIELWKDGKHQNRAISAGVLNTKEVDPDEKDLVFNLFDCLFNKFRDIHMSPYSERLKHLKSFLFVKKAKTQMAETRIVKSEGELRKALSYFSKLEGSEGAYLKLYTFPYTLTGRTTENIKFKNELSVEVQIVKVNIVGAAKKK